MMDEPDWRSMARAFQNGEPDPRAGGMEFGDYILEEEIARGGMGIVYRAWQIPLDRQVALKVMREGLFADDREVARFRQEASAAAALRHPGLVPVYESGEFDGRVFYAMEWINGPNLAEVTKDHPVTATQAARWVLAVAQVIQHAHEQGVVHRDLKPANVLLDPSGQPRVTDFGMARREDTASGLTLSGQMLGTPGYMAPETAETGARMSGPAVDIYGLGALLFHLITGRAPFIGESHAAVLRQMAENEPVSPRLLNAGVPRDLDTVCLKALAREPSRRYATAAGMARDLNLFSRGRPVLARPVSGLERAWRYCRRKPALAASFGTVALLLVGVAGISTWAAARLEKARASESEERGRAEQGRREAKLNLYAADVRMAGQLYQNGALESARRLLAGHIPAKSEEDFRGFDWHFLWAALAGDQIRKAALPMAPVGDNMPVSPDGKWVLLAGDSDAALVELATQRIVARWKEARGSGYYLRYVFWSAPADRIIVTGGDRVRLIDPRTGNVSYAGEGGAEVASLSHDGRVLILAPARVGLSPPPPRLELWDMVAGRETGRYTLPNFARALAWLPDDSQIVAGINPRTILWLRPGDGSTLRELTLSPPGEGANMPWAWFSPDGARAAIPWWDSDEVTPVYDLKDGSVLTQLEGLSHGATRMTWSPDGRWLAGSGSEQAIFLYGENRWKEPQLLRGHLGLTGGLAFASAESLVTVSADQTARWWTVPPKKAEPLYPNDMTGSHVWRPAWSPDGTMVTIASRFGINSDGAMKGVLWDCAKQAPGFEWNETGLAFSPDSRRILTVENNKLYRIRDTASGQEIRQFKLERDGGFRLPRVSPDGRWMVVWHEPRTGTLYDMSTGNGQKAALLEGGSEAAFSPDSLRLAREADMKLVLRDLVSGHEKTTDVAAHLAITWSPDGTTLATRLDNEIHLVNAATGQRTDILSGQAARIGVMLFLPDGRTMLTSGEDGALRLWNLATRRETLTLSMMSSCAYYCAVSPDGHSILAGGARGYQFFSLPADSGMQIPQKPGSSALSTRSLWSAETR